MGWWHGGRLAVYAGIKLPLLLILTWILTFPFGWMLNQVTGRGVPLRELAPASVHPLVGAGVALLALVPVNLLFTLSFPQPDPGEPINHNALYLIHVLTVSACGLLATGPLRRLLRESGRAGTALFAGWVGVYALVAGEIAWALRPFLGNPYQPVRFLRSDALDGNVYEFIWTDILPRFLGAR